MIQRFSPLRAAAVISKCWGATLSSSGRKIVTRPSLPKTRGPYTVEGLTPDGMRVFELSFDGVEVADDPRGARHFAFAVPIGEGAAARLGSLRLTGPAGRAASTSKMRRSRSM